MELVRGLGGSARPRGRPAAQALGLDLAFSELRLQKVWSEVIAGNEAALKAQAAAGFRREGYMRRHVLKGGERHDVVVLGHPGRGVGRAPRRHAPGPAALRPHRQLIALFAGRSPHPLTGGKG
jgi:hypothetical protein